VYELVSPPGTGSGIGGVFPLGSLTLSPEEYGRPFQSSGSGDAITYLGEDFYQPHLGSLNQYVSKRNVADWSTQNLTPGTLSLSEEPVEANPYVAFSPDLSKAVVSVRSAPLVDGVPAGFANLYLVQNGSFEPLITIQPQNRSAATFGHAIYGESDFKESLLFAGGNAGSGVISAFSHILFEANDALTQANGASTPNAKDGGPYQNNLYEWSGGNVQLVNVLPEGETHPHASFGVDNGDRYSGFLPSLSHAISADGSRIFWTDENTGKLYVREDGKKTVQIDALVGGGGEFQTASVDGSKVFFTKEEILYQFDTTEEKTHALAVGGVKGLVGASDDGAYVYFVSTRAFEGGVEGSPNLYLSHEGRLVFIATLSLQDNETPNLYGTDKPYGDWFRTFAGRTAEVSPNGRYLAFLAREKLTGYENLDARGVEHDFEIFLYDAATRGLECPSCNTDGTRPTSNSLLPTPTNGVYQQRSLTDGGRLFFSTTDAVLPQDGNRKSDVYEYENGRIYLISPGLADSEAVFADASESGSDVFFTAQQRLTAGSDEEITDLYDARVGGRGEELSPPSCSEEACRALPTPTPSFEAPSSNIFTGAGNSAPPTLLSTGTRNSTTGIRRVKRKRHVKHRGHTHRPGRRTRKSTGK
jgi:hypothetical protein